jgi:hypothetical protein
VRPPIIRRNVKPGNVVLDPAGEAWLVDFGAVRDASGTSCAQGRTLRRSSGRTATCPSSSSRGGRSRPPTSTASGAGSTGTNAFDCAIRVSASVRCSPLVAFEQARSRARSRYIMPTVARTRHVLHCVHEAPATRRSADEAEPERVPPPRRLRRDIRGHGSGPPGGCAVAGHASPDPARDPRRFGSRERAGGRPSGPRSASPFQGRSLPALGPGPARAT